MLLTNLLIFTSLLSITQTAKILVIIAIGGNSHKNFFDSLTAELAKNGHNLTVFSQHLPKTTFPNVKDVYVESMKSEEAVQHAVKLTNSHPVALFGGFKSFVESGCVNILENSEFKAILDNNEQFDAVIVTSFMNECTLMLSSLFSKVIIQVAAGPWFPWMFQLVTQPLSFVPNSMWALTNEMTFMERVCNTLNSLVIRFVYNYYLIKDIESMVWQHYPKALSIAEAEKRVSLVLQNADPVLTGPIPSLPHIIDIGGIHCRDAKPIPKEFDEFIKSSGDHGFILFGLGANVKSKFLPNETVQSFLNAFARLKQNVIWKYEDNLKDTPKNVLITKWLPQQDLLGDKRIRLFITHGGLLSLQEAVYHQVPVIGIPIFTDQPGNIARAVQLHIGVLLRLTDVTEQSVYDATVTILNDNRYATNVRKYSSIFRNQPEKPIERANFWIEYALRQKEKSMLVADNQINFFVFYSGDLVLFSVLFGVAVYLVLKFYLSLL